MRPAVTDGEWRRQVPGEIRPRLAHPRPWLHGVEDVDDTDRLTRTGQGHRDVVQRGILEEEAPELVGVDLQHTVAQPRGRAEANVLHLIARDLQTHGFSSQGRHRIRGPSGRPSAPRRSSAPTPRLPPWRRPAGPEFPRGAPGPRAS